MIGLMRSPLPLPPPPQFDTCAHALRNKHLNSGIMQIHHFSWLPPRDYCFISLSSVGCSLRAQRNKQKLSQTCRCLNSFLLLVAATATAACHPSNNNSKKNRPTDYIKHFFHFFLLACAVHATRGAAAAAADAAPTRRHIVIIIPRQVSDLPLPYCHSWLHLSETCAAAAPLFVCCIEH